jgi:hypothetical protein
MGNPQIDNPEKLVTQGTQDEENTTQYNMDTTIRKQAQLRYEPSYNQLEVTASRVWTAQIT